jgi:hypothetical protein
MEDLTDFFYFLSLRLRKETNLSDITWALCKANQKFRDMFLNFCFNKKVPEMEIISREIQSNDSRPDFFCIDKNRHKYIIEIKINDKNNLHLEQYRDEFPDAARAFIANYNGKKFCDTDSDWSITTWKNFIDFLKEEIDKEDKEDKEDEMINGYVEYLKNIMRYTEVEKMNLNEVTSLPVFSHILEDIITEYDEKTLKFSNQPKSFFEKRYGRCISFNDKFGNNILFWIGILLENSPCLYLFFDAEKDILVKKIEKIEKAQYFYIDEEEGFPFFYLEDSYHDILFSDGHEIKEQKDVISNFLKEILDFYNG